MKRLSCRRGLSLSKVAILPPLLFALLLVGIVTTPARAAIPLPPAVVMANIDVQFAAYLSKFATFQASYAVTNLKYYQSLRIHSSPPTDGALVAPDLLDSAPTDQANHPARELWNWVVMPVTLPATYSVDTYDGPSGKGYIVVIQATLGGDVWCRAINTGPELWRDQPWAIVKPEPSQ